MRRRCQPSEVEHVKPLLWASFAVRDPHGDTTRCCDVALKARQDGSRGSASASDAARESGAVRPRACPSQCGT